MIWSMPSSVVASEARWRALRSLWACSAASASSCASSLRQVRPKVTASWRSAAASSRCSASRRISPARYFSVSASSLAWRGGSAPASKAASAGPGLADSWRPVSSVRLASERVQRCCSARRLPASRRARSRARVWSRPSRFAVSAARRAWRSAAEATRRQRRASSLRIAVSTCPSSRSMARSSSSSTGLATSRSTAPTSDSPRLDSPCCEPAECVYSPGTSLATTPKPSQRRCRRRDVALVVVIENSSVGVPVGSHCIERAFGVKHDDTRRRHIL